MENINLDEMRAQFAILQDKLQKQEIVSDRLLRETMKAKTTPINFNKRIVYICTGICIALLILLSGDSEPIFSIPFIIFTCLAVLFSAVATYYIHKPVDKLDFMHQDLATVARIMAKFKQQYDNWLRYVTPTFLAIWFPWACIEYAPRFCPAGENPLPYCLPLLIGGLIGLFIGLKSHFRAVNAAKDILNQIEDK